MIPNPITAAAAAINLISTATHQFAAWYTLANELRIGRIERGVQDWGVDHDEYEFAGTPRTALGLPVDTDNHKYPAVAVDGLGKLHVWANMHANVLRAVKSTTAHTTDDWLATAGWASATSDFPSVDIRCTYPTPIHLPDGGIWFYLRDGPTGSGSNRSDSHYWTRGPSATSWSARTTLFQGLSVPDAGGPGVPGDDASVDSRTNWNSYPNNPYVESPRDPHPGRMHMTWIWRAIPDFNAIPSYAYSDNGGVTWKAIDGTTLTLPITPLNNHASRIPGSAFITEITRASNIVVAQADTPNHGIQVGDTVQVRVVDTSYDGSFTVGTVGGGIGANGIAWGQTAADDAAGGTGNIVNIDTSDWGGVAPDGIGNPHMFAWGSTRYYIHHDGTTWQRTALPSSFNGFTPFHGPPNPFSTRNGIWMLNLGDPGHARRCRLWQITGGTGTVAMSGVVGGDGSSFDPSADPEAWRRFGTIEVLWVDGDTPHVATYGNHSRIRAA